MAPQQRLPHVLVLVFSRGVFLSGPIWVNYSLIPDPAPDKRPERKTQWFNWSTPVNQDQDRIGVTHSHLRQYTSLFKNGTAADELSDIGNSILMRLEKQRQQPAV